MVDVEKKKVEGEGWYDIMEREEREKKREKVGEDKGIEI